MPSYSAIRDGIRFLRWASTLYLDDPPVRATRVSRRRAHVRVFSRRLPAGSEAPRSAFTIGKERQMRRDRNWPWHVGDGADRREVLGREAGDREREIKRKREDDENMESDGGPRRDRANLELFA